LGTSFGVCFLQELFTKKKSVKMININCDDFFIIVLLKMTLQLLETLRHGSLQRLRLGDGLAFNVLSARMSAD
jgi:hypothetical protein